MRVLDDRTPILIGCGDITDRTTPIGEGRSPYDLIASAGRLALADCNARGVNAAIDTVAMIRSFADTSPRFATKLGSSRNPPRSIANRLGLQPTREIYTWSGGNMPQYLVNSFAEAIASGQMQAGLIVGGEALRTQHGVERAGLDTSWTEDPGGQPELVGDARRGWSDHEDAYGMRAAIAMYPLIENAFRGSLSRNLPDHMAAMGVLFARFADVAAKNPLAARRDGFSARNIAEPTEQNRFIGFPYTRLMNANAFIDQAAALVMTSVGLARALGVPEHKWVFLHGCADACDHWHVSERWALDRSPAMARGIRQALAMADRALGDIDIFDIYSCFPSAVEIACREAGLAEDDPRGLTITGGLPYFGGPGNAYVMHSIAEMMRQCRARKNAFGLVTANGNYITKHSWGVYSTRPFLGPWRRENPAALQAELDALPKSPFTQTPTGAATIETYTIMHGRQGPELAIIVGREDFSGRRFLANAPGDRATLEDLQAKEGLGRKGRVAQVEGRAVFMPD